MIHKICCNCGKKRNKGVDGVYRRSRCWDMGFCSICAEKNYKVKTQIYGSYTVTKKQGERFGFSMPREPHTAPTIVQINKASGKRLIELLDRRIGEIPWKTR